MKKIEPKILPGFMELLPADQVLFNQIKDTICETYERFGFIPLDTPIIEYSEVLLAKAGGETEKQIYRFTKGENDISLRFDLTVPLSRYVAQNYFDLTFPFRRYQIGKSFRGEKPQKGRYREFYQCDIDIIGDGELSIMNDAEIPSIIYTVFKKLGFENFTIRMNNRKILGGFFSSLGYSENITDILRIIDKLEKIGESGVRAELKSISLNDESIDKIIKFVTITGNCKEVIAQLRELGISDEVFENGVNELEAVTTAVKNFGLPENNYKIDLTIARGLDYYTGTVYETVLNDYPKLGSVCSGGRYDNLAEYYTNKKLPGVGVSIGLTRLFYQFREAGIMVPKQSSLAKVMIVPMTDDLSYSIKLASNLRERGINTEVYYNQKSIKGKFNYANKLSIPYVVVIGEDEIANNKFTVKNMEKGEQVTVDIDELYEILGE